MRGSGWKITRKREKPRPSGRGGCQKKRFPDSPKSSYVVAKVRRRTQAQELMQEAADEIERLRNLVQHAAPVVAELGDQFYVQDSRSTVGNDMLWLTCQQGREENT